MKQGIEGIWDGCSTWEYCWSYCKFIMHRNLNVCTRTKPNFLYRTKLGIFWHVFFLIGISFCFRIDSSLFNNVFGLQLYFENGHLTRQVQRREGKQGQLSPPTSNILPYRCIELAKSENLTHSHQWCITNDVIIWAYLFHGLGAWIGGIWLAQYWRTRSCFFLPPNQLIPCLFRFICRQDFAHDISKTSYFDDFGQVQMKSKKSYIFQFMHQIYFNNIWLVREDGGIQLHQFKNNFPCKIDELNRY